jgi:transposase-like protein
MNENKVKAMEVVGDSAGVLSEANKTKIVAAWAASGMTAPGFAPQAGVPAHRLYEWRRAARQRQNETTAVVSFVEVPREAATSSGWAAEALTRSGPVRFSLTASPAWAGQLIRELNRC